jgi:pyruvate/2-oxoglutarate dehydrogenase complex dihydrolipoamide dehydrogenase (E3) component
MGIIKADLAVVGGGPGGYVASIRASKMGLKTAVIERDYLGGVYLNCGCIPTKTLYHVAFILNEIKKVKDFGIDVSKVIYNVFRKKGIEIFTDAIVEKVEKSGDDFICTVSGGNKITADKVLISVGRRPNSSDIGIEKAGVEVDQKGYIKVDSHLRTNVRGIYAVGDVIGGLQLAHVASEEGKIAEENIAGKNKEMDYSVVPWAVFTSP